VPLGTAQCRPGEVRRSLYKPGRFPLSGVLPSPFPLLLGYGQEKSETPLPDLGGVGRTFRIRSDPERAVGAWSGRISFEATPRSSGTNRKAFEAGTTGPSPSQYRLSLPWRDLLPVMANCLRSVIIFCSVGFPREGSLLFLHGPFRLWSLMLQ